MTKVSIIDMIAKKLRRCIAIVEDGDTASQAIASGKFVIWKGNPCKASTAISAGATLSNSNLTALSDGIGNELNGNISKLIEIPTGNGPFYANKDSGSNILILRLGYNNNSDFLQLVINANDKTIKLNRKVGGGSETTLATWTGA